MIDWLITEGEAYQAYLFFALMPVLFALEWLFPKRAAQSSPYRRWGNNLALTVLAILVLPLVPVSFVTAAFWAESAGIGLLNGPGSSLPGGVLALLTLLIRAFISFGTHWLNHRVPVLWRIHRVHHLDTELDVTSTVRFHPLEMPLSLLIGLPVIVLFGLSPWVLIFYELLDVSVTLFSHSNVRIPRALDRVLHYLIVTPDLHKVHHSSHQPETDSNFSAVFPIWDLLFGTFRTETREPLETMQLGLTEWRAPQADRFWWLLVSPLRSKKSLVTPAGASSPAEAHS